MFQPELAQHSALKIFHQSRKKKEKIFINYHGLIIVEVINETKENKIGHIINCVINFKILQ